MVDRPGNLIVFTKPPQKGKVKTRLASTIGDDNAHAVYLEMLRLNSEVLLKVRCKVWCFSDGAWEEARHKFGDQFRLQNGKDLGEKMRNAIMEVIKLTNEATVLVGTDCPDLGANHIHSALDKLDEHDIVFGPSADGGYYLIGMKKDCWQVFNGMVWSSPDVLQISLDRAFKSGLRSSLVETLRDVDEWCDLLRSSIYNWYQLKFERKNT